MSATGLAQLAFLVGGTWVASHADGEIEERCTWAPGDRLIRTLVTHRRGGASLATARGAFCFDAAEGVLRSWSFSSAGAYLSAVQTGGAEAPPTWTFRTTVQGARRAEARVTITRLGPDEMTIAQEAAGGSAVTLRYRRTVD